MTFKYFNVPSLSYLITCLQLKSYVVISTKGEIIATDGGCYLPSLSLSNRNTYLSLQTEKKTHLIRLDFGMLKVDPIGREEGKVYRDFFLFLHFKFC